MLEKMLDDAAIQWDNVPDGWLKATWRGHRGWVETSEYELPVQTETGEIRCTFMTYDPIHPIPVDVTVGIGSALAGKDMAIPGDVLSVPREEIILA